MNINPDEVLVGDYEDREYLALIVKQMQERQDLEREQTRERLRFQTRKLRMQKEE